MSTPPAAVESSDGLDDDVVGNASFCVVVPFPLRSKSNFRRRSQSRDWAVEQAFRRDLSVVVSAARPVNWPMGDATVPVAQRPAVACVIVATSTLDTANLSKSVLDALEGVVYHTDAQVRYQCAVSNRGRSAQRAVLAFAALDADTELSELHAHGARLAELALDVFARAA